MSKKIQKVPIHFSKYIQAGESMSESQKSLVERLISFIVRRRKVIEGFFILMVVLSAMGALTVKVNYDLTEYLPDWMPTKQGIDIMEQEFGYPGTARVMVKDVSIYEAKHYKDLIASIDGVDSVSWADTAVDIYSSTAFLQTADLDDYYKDGCAVYDVIFTKGDSDPVSYAAIEEIRRTLGDKVRLSGPTVENQAVAATFESEMPRILTIGVVMIIIILTLTTNSWFEPVLFMVTMGVAVIINTGSNVIFGTISFLSANAAALLQIAVALDYSIFLLHTFTAEKEKGIETEQAMENSLRIAVSSILSSGLTTIIGFLALVLMQFTIGRDIGLVMAKGIVCSMLTVLLLMPALIIRWKNIIDKLGHKPFVPPLYGFAKRAFSLRHAVAVFVVIVVIPCYVAQGMTDFKYGTSVVGCAPGTPSYIEKEEIDELFGESNPLIAVVPNKGNVLEKRLADELDELPYVKSVMALSAVLPQGIPESFLPKSLTGELHSEDYSRLLISIKSDTESAAAYAYDDDIKAIVAKYYPEGCYYLGKTPATKDIQEVILSDNKKVNFISLLGVAIVVLVSFGSPTIMLAVLIPIETAIYLNMALPYIYGEQLAYLGYLMVSSMQLGSTVDYSILMTNNYIDIRTGEADKKRAAIKTIPKSALSIITSGSVLTIVGYGLNFMSSVPAVVDLGHLIGRGGALSVILVLTLLPLLLNLFDKQIFKDRQRKQARRQKRLERKRRGQLTAQSGGKAKVTV